MRLLTPAGKILLALDGARRPLLAREIQERTGLSRATVYLNLARLMADGLVREEGDGYVLTSEGRRAVEELRSLVTASTVRG